MGCPPLASKELRKRVRYGQGGSTRDTSLMSTHFGLTWPFLEDDDAFDAWLEEDSLPMWGKISLRYSCSLDLGRD